MLLIALENSNIWTSFISFPICDLRGLLFLSKFLFDTFYIIGEYQYFPSKVIGSFKKFKDSTLKTSFNPF